MEALLDAITTHGVRRPKCQRLADQLGLKSIEDIPRLTPDCLDKVSRQYKLVVIHLRNAHVDLYTTRWNPDHMLAPDDMLY